MLRILILVCFLLIAGCRNNQTSEVKVLNCTNLSDYVISNEEIVVPSSTNETFPNANSILKSDWSEIAKTIDSGRKFDVLFNYDKVNKKLSPIRSEQLKKLSKTEQDDLYRITLYILKNRELETKTEPLNQTIIGSFEWSKPLPEALISSSAVFLGVKGDVAIRAGQGTYHYESKSKSAVIDDYIITGNSRGVGFKNHENEGVPISGTFSLEIYQKKFTNVEQEKLVFLLPESKNYGDTHIYKETDGGVSISSDAKKVSSNVCVILSPK